MSYNIGPKIGIDGEAEFRRQIKQINDEYKALEAETSALTAAFKANGDEQGALKSQSAQCEKQIAKQKEKMELLSDAVDKAAAKYGENSIEATRLRGALYDTQTTVSNLEGKMRDSEHQLDEFENGMEEVGDATKNAGDDVLEFGDILGATFMANMATDMVGKAKDVLIDFAKGSLDAAADVKAAGSQFEQTFGDMQKQAEKSLESISKKTNIAVSRMQGSFTSIFAFMKTNGADSASALSLSERAIMAAADSAAYYDKTVEQATETLQSFLKGNYENDTALGISATETTRNAKANELFAKSFKELSESQKVETLLAMVEAGNAASGALGQAARESSEWTNVLGEAGEAIRLVQAEIGKPVIKLAIPVIKEFTQALQDMVKKTDLDVLTEEMENFDEAVSGSKDLYESTAKGIEANAYAAERYVAYLEELESAGLETAESQRSYANIVAELNELMPGYNWTLSKQTGLLMQNKDAIYTSIEAMKEQALQEAKREQLTGILQAQGKAVLALEDAEKALAVAEAEATDLHAQKAKIEKDLMATTEELNKMQAGLASTYGAQSTGAVELRAKQEELRAQSSALGGEYMALNDQIKANAKTQQELTAAIEQGKISVSQYDEELKAVTGTETEAAEKSKALELAVTETQTAVDELTAAYDAACKQARTSISQQIGLFDELTIKSDYSAQKIIDNWINQKAAFDNYKANLEKAVELGLDETLVKQLSDGSEQSMQILNTLVNDADVSIDDINASFSKMSHARDSVADAMAGIQTEYEKTMTEIQGKAEQDGVYIVDGVARGVNSRMGAFGSSMSSLGNHGLHAFNSQMEIYSPSRKMRKSGNYIGDGAILGVEDKVKNFEASMAGLATSGENAFLSHKLSSMGSSLPGLNLYGSAPVSKVYNDLGGLSVQVYQQPGESSDDLIDRMMDKMQAEVDRRRDAI